METTNYYKVGGSLTHNHRTYVVRQADCQLLNFLKAGEYCFILNSRQMGKSSLRVRTGKKLRSEGFRCAFIDLTLIGSHVSVEKWYKGIAYQILDSLEIDTELDFNTWWQQHEHLTDLQRFQQLIESVILVKISQSIVIFIDEIDSLIKINFKDDFFAFLRACYNQRSENPDYNRLIFCLLGVASPADLIQDRGRTPFNIGKSIELTGFTFAEAKDALLPGLKEKLENPEVILQQVLKWTGGQPFLTQKLCRLIVCYVNRNCSDIKQLVEDYVIKNWEVQDEPEHLRTIRNRLLIDENKTIGILGLYQLVLLSKIGIIADESDEQTALRLSGLVVKKNNTLQVYNPIYKTVFNWDWINHQLTHLRPYSEAINLWLKYDHDSSYLLHGETLKNALEWSNFKHLSNEDYQFLATSQSEKDRKINQFLTEANEKSTQIIRRGIIILFTTLIVSIIIAYITSMYAQKQIRNARETIRIEKSATNSLKLFESKQLDGLISAIEAGQELKALVKHNESLDKYSTTKPFDALLNSLTQISEQNQFKGHKAGVKTVIFSPDGELVVSGSDDGTIKLWKRDSTLIKTLSNVGNVFSVRFSPNGEILASGSHDGTIKLWQKDGKLLKTLTRDNSIYTFTFTPKAEILASGGRDGKIKLWSSNGKLIQTINGHTGSIYTINFSPNGEMIASGSNDGIIKLWRRDGTLINTLAGHQGSVNTVIFSPDGQIITSGSNDNTVKLWNLKGKLIKTLNGHNAEVNSISFSPDGKIIASGSGDKTIKLWRRDGTLIKTLTGHNDSVMSVSFSPDKKELASASLDATIKLWNLTDTPIPRFKGHQNIVTSVSFSPDETKIVSSSLDTTIKLWNLDGEIVKTFKCDGKWIYFVSFSPDGKTLAAVTSDGIVELRQEDGELIQTLADPQGDVTRVSFSPDGSIATGSSNHSVKLWNKDGKLRKTLTGHNSDVTSINYSPDGKILASGSSDGSIKLWRGDGMPIQTRAGHNGQVTQISFSRDGKQFASSSEDGTVKLWKIDGKEIAIFSDHNQGVTSVNFHPNGKILASSSTDGTINLWKSDGTLLFSISVGNEVTSVAFSPNGQILVAGSSDGSIILWSLILDDLLGRGCNWLKDYLVHHPQPIVCLK